MSDFQKKAPEKNFEADFSMEQSNNKFIQNP